MYLYPILGGIGISLVLIIFFGTQFMMASEITNISNDDLVFTENGYTDISSTQPEKKIYVTDGIKHLVPLEKIRDGGPPKDGIPSIDEPRFVGIQDSQFVSDSDVVIGLNIDGDVRAYPLFILVWHEIVNDKVGSVPVSITYCPLCYTTQVFERIIDGEEVEFGTSGKLYNSNLVMYDRTTGSYWSQGLGTAIEGKLTGLQLSTVPFDVIAWGDWKELHPDTLVLTTETGYSRAYGVDPYGDYYTESRLMFPVENMDDRMHPKETILGLDNGHIYKAFRQKDIETQKIINDFVGTSPVVLVSQYPQNARVFDRTVDGEILEFVQDNEFMMDIQTKSSWTYDGMAISGPMTGKILQRTSINPGFWFEWVAFHPDTLVYGES